VGYGRDSISQSFIFSVLYNSLGPYFSLVYLLPDFVSPRLLLPKQLNGVLLSVILLPLFVFPLEPVRAGDLWPPARPDANTG
jgi:hypothetical protein